MCEGSDRPHKMESNFFNKALAFTQDLGLTDQAVLDPGDIWCCTGSSDVLMEKLGLCPQGFKFKLDLVCDQCVLENTHTVD